MNDELHEMSVTAARDTAATAPGQPVSRRRLQTLTSGPDSPPDPARTNLG